MIMINNKGEWFVMNQVKKILNRLKNKKVFLAVASGILLILVNFQVIDIALSDKILENINIMLAIGVAIGIFSNPDSHTNKETK